MSETIRRENSRERVLALLQAKGHATNIELNSVCYRFGARILELRALGYVIETGAKRGGVVSYSYKGLKTAAQIGLFA